MLVRKKEREKMDQRGHFHIFHILILKLNSMVKYNITFYRKFLATKADHSAPSFVETAVNNYLAKMRPLRGIAEVQTLN